VGEFSPIYWVIVLAVIVILFGGRRIPEVMRGMGEEFRNGSGPRGGHPVPVTGPVEKALWKGVLRSLPHRKSSTQF
jgi:TatA/E family protein of Tat protein translocase